MSLSFESTRVGVMPSPACGGAGTVLLLCLLSLLECLLTGGGGEGGGAISNVPVLSLWVDRGGGVRGGLISKGWLPTVELLIFLLLEGLVKGYG
jgi:hypothetical protein